MFFGVQVASGSFSEVEVPEGYDPEWLQAELHRAVLVDGVKGKQTVLYVDHDKYQKVAVASLSPENPQVSLDVPFHVASDIRFSVEGPGTVHVCGAFNTEDTGDEEDGFNSDEAAEEEEEEEDVAERSNLYARTDDASTSGGESEEEEEEETAAAAAVAESDEEGESSSEDDEPAPPKKAPVGKEQESSDSESEEAKPTSQLPKSKVAAKRKTPSSVQSPPPAAKKEKKEGSGAMPEEHKFKEAVVNYLKKNGACSIGQLGSKVQKPPSLKAVKWSQFLKKFPVFKVDGQNVSLAH